MSNDKFLHDRLYRGSDFEKFPYPKIAICGLGTVGSNLVDNLIRQNFTNLLVIDFDRVEPHNLGNQIWTMENIGQEKVDAAECHAYNVLGIEIDGFSKRLDRKNIHKVLKKVNLVVDCFDNVESRQLVTDFCKQEKIPCLHIGLAADYCEVVWNEYYTVPNGGGDDVCDYPLTRHISMVSVVLATEEIIKWVCERDLSNRSFTLSDFKCGEY